MDFRTRVLIEQEMNGKNHLYRCLLANNDEYGNSWKDTIFNELSGKNTGRDFVSYCEFENLCAEIEEWYYDNFNKDVDENYVGETILRLIEYEFDINIGELSLPWLNDWREQYV